ncbi:tetratricopeptide repeat protein [Myxococcota bacterium]|nr:tetratricopeptide repeat protein [Myxococcota bacterium]MBU1896996.1 tetratricopeptide repeat protein [Myxococcota bacterium]
MSGRAQRGQFYGRDIPVFERLKELYGLREAMRNAIDHRIFKRALVLSAPGLGKSRLLAELLATIDEHVDAVAPLSVRCEPDGPPYQPLWALLQARFQISRKDTDNVARARLLSGLTALLGDSERGEEAAQIIGHLVGLSLPEAQHLERLDAQGRLTRAVEIIGDLLVLDAARAPLLIAVDDVHHASKAMFRLAERLSRRLEAAPILFVATAGLSLRADQPALTRAAQREGGLFELTGLSDRACTRLVEALLAPMRPIPEAFIAEVAARALGNPLSAEQIIEWAIARGAISIEGGWRLHPDRLEGGLPQLDNLHGAITHRLSALGEAERATLECAAIIGERFCEASLIILDRLTQPSSPWPEEAPRLAQTLQALKQRQIIGPSHRGGSAGGEAFAFKHGLEREVILEGIDPERRRQAHVHLAAWMAADPQRASQMSAQIAAHWLAGGRPVEASRYQIMAADAALARSDSEEALGLYEASLAVLDEARPEQRRHIHHQLAKIRMLRGEHAAARLHLREMLSLTWALNLPSQGGLALHKLGQSCRALGEYEEALTHLKRARTLFRKSEDIRGLAATADEIGRVHRFKGDLTLAEEHIREGLRLRRYIDDTRSVALSLNHLANVFVSRGDLASAAARFEEGLTLARAAEDQRTEAELLTGLGAQRAALGRVEEAFDLWAQARPMAQALGDVALTGAIAQHIGASLLEKQDPEAAKPVLEEAVAIFRDIADQRGLAEARLNLGRAYLNLGDAKRALRCVMEAKEGAERISAQSIAAAAERALGAIYAQTLFSDGELERRLDAASEHFSAALVLFEILGQEVEIAKTCYAFGASLAEGGRVEEARARLTRAEAIFRRLEMPQALARVRRALGAL